MSSGLRRPGVLALFLIGCGSVEEDIVPDTVLELSPPALTNEARAMFAFRAIGTSNGFVCVIDDQLPGPCVPPVEIELDDGAHTFSVAASLNGVADETPATHAWRIDTVAPDTTLVAGPPAIDNDPEPAFTFEGSDEGGGPITFECALDDATPAACTSPFTVSVVDGDHRFTVTAVDEAGNRDESPVLHDWSVTTIAPDTEITIGPEAGAVTANAVVFEFTSPDATATFECSLDAAAFAACTSPHSLSGLADGAHELAVRAVGTAGADPSPATRAWTVDAVGPVVTITGTPSNPSNDPAPQFTFSANEAATFECQIDGVVAFTACTSPFTAPALADGNRTFRVRAADTVGNPGNTATFAWLVDTAAPSVTLTAQPAALSNTNDPAVTFTVAGGATATTCQLDAGTPVACTSPHSFGNVADGNHTITVRATDAANNAGTATTNPFAIDTVAPTVTITTEPAALSNNNDPSVAFTVAGNPTAIQCRIDAGAFAACTSPHGFTNIDDGNHTISVRVTDGAGNASTATTGTFAIDTAAPTVTIANEPAALSNNNDPSVSFTTSGSPTTITCQLDTGTPVACASPRTFTNVSDGPHTITVRVTDDAGNQGSDTTGSFTIDTVAPTVTITSEPAALSNNDDPSVAFTVAGNPTVTQCRIDTGAFATCSSPHAFANVGDGAHTITVRVADGAGNETTDTTASFTIDTVAPTVAISGEPSALSNNADPVVTFTTSGAPTSTTCQLDSGTPVACTSPHTFADVGDGDHTITVRVSDDANNQASDTTAGFTIDTVAPTVAIGGEPAALSNDRTPTVTFTTGGSPTSIQCRVDAGVLATCSSPFTTSVSDGTHTITVQVTDGAGNTASATTDPFQVDSVAPEVSFTDAPPASWPVNYFDMAFTANETATFECSLGAAAFSACTSPSGVVTTYGAASTFRVRATDAAGNTAIATTTWTSRTGLALHFPWEQGDTDNTSVLAASPPHSPRGSVGTLGTVVGGWAGTAIGSTLTEHAYAGTRRVLSSAAQPGFYTASFWLRASDGGQGTLLDTLGGTGGLRVTLNGGTLLGFQVRNPNGQLTTAEQIIAVDRWVHVALVATGPAKGLQVFIDGSFRLVIPAPLGTGFDAGQTDLVVGPWSGIDLDDLRFFNEAVSQVCEDLAHGFRNGNGICVPLSPGFEVDFENDRVVDTGAWRLPFTAPQTATFVSGKTGDAMRLATGFEWGFQSGFRANVNAVPSGGRSFSFWFDANTAFGPLIDFAGQCSVGGPPGTCGIAIDYRQAGRIDVFTGTAAGVQRVTQIPVRDGRRNSIVVTEQRSDPKTTDSITVFVNGEKFGISIGAGNIYEAVTDNVRFNVAAGSVVDELEFWTIDLASDAELLCANGFDGRFDHVDGTCALTSN